MCMSLSSGPPWEGARILQLRYHRWWIMDFGVRPRDKTPKSGVAHCKLSPSQESENEQIQNQIDVNFFFLTVRGSSIRNLCHEDKLWIKHFIGKSLKDRKRVACVRPGIARTWMLYHDNSPCHTAISVNEFLAEKSIPVVPQPPYSPDLSPWTSFYSPGSKTTWKGAILILWIISRRA